MYALNSFLRILRFVSNSLVGFVFGFFVGYVFGSSGLSISQFFSGIGL